MLPGIFVLGLVTLVWRELRIPKALVPGSSPSQPNPSITLRSRSTKAPLAIIPFQSIANGCCRKCTKTHDIRQVSDKCIDTGVRHCGQPRAHRGLWLWLSSVRRSLTIGYEESFQEIAQLIRQFPLRPGMNFAPFPRENRFQGHFRAKERALRGEREPAGRKGPCQHARHTLEGGQIEIHVGVDNANLAGHDLENQPRGLIARKRLLLSQILTRSVNPVASCF